MVWNRVQNDWQRFLSNTIHTLPYLRAGDDLKVPPGRETFRDYLAREGELTPREAEELIEWRLLPGYCRTCVALPAE